MNRIAAYSTYLPGNVLTRAAAAEAWPLMTMAGHGKTVPSLDEDALTMAAQASLQLLERAEVDGADLAGVLLATTSSPYVVKSGAAVVGDYVNAPDSACVLDFGAASHAGLLALLSALRDPALATRGPILVIGSDAARGRANDPSDLGFGAGAAAFLVSTEGFARLEASYYSRSSYGGVWQPAGERELHRYDDDRFDRFAGWAPQMTAGLRRVLAEVDSEPDVYALSLPANGRGEAAVAAAGGDAERIVGAKLTAAIGDTGCANALLNLALALDRAEPGQTVLAQAYGPGAGTAGARLAIEAADRRGSGPPPEAEDDRIELSYVQYAKHRGLLPMSELPSFGAPYAASPGWERSKSAVVGLHAGRCRACGSLNFPPRDYCLDCRGEEFERVPLPRRATVETFNLQFVVGIGPEEAPLPICTAVLEGEPADRYGGKVAALVTDADPDQIEIGSPVELVPRRGDLEEGLVKYGWKFRPPQVPA